MFKTTSGHGGMTWCGMTWCVHMNTSEHGRMTIRTTIRASTFLENNWLN